MSSLALFYALVAVQRFYFNLCTPLRNGVFPAISISQDVNSSVQFSCSVMSDSLQPHGLLHTRPLCPSPSPGVCSNSGPLSRWCHPTISSSVVPLSFCLQSFPASGSSPMSQFFTSGGQSIEASASALVLPKNIWDWFPLELRRGTVISKRKESVILDQDTPYWGVGEGKRTAGGLYHADFL